MILIHKGTSTFWNEEELKNADDALGDILISVFHTLDFEREIENENNKNKGLQIIERSRAEGLIHSYFNALSNEIHHLAIQIDMIQYFINDKEDNQTKLKTNLYLTSLIESYIISLRSIFDYISVVYRIVVNEKYIQQIPQKDSFNDLLKFIKKGSAAGIIPNEIIELFKAKEPLFTNIKTVRDLIVHKGKEPIIYKAGEVYSFSIHKNKHFPLKNVLDNILELEDGEKDIYPILPYLSKLTNDLLDMTGLLGIAIMNSLSIDKIVLSAFEGLCIPNFIKFLRTTNKEI
jgi:hypothetical protein